jgi:predicted metal-dependent hydrolase
MSPQDEQAHFIEGVRLFNAGQFFEAHEIWEDAWRDAEGVRREFLQGLIQCAVALEHLRRGNPRGIARLQERFERRLSVVPVPFMGLDVKRFLDEMRHALSTALDSPGIPIAPRIRLIE